MKDYSMTPMYKAWDERKHTMDMVYKMLLEACDKLSPEEAVTLTNSVSDQMMVELSGIYKREKHQRVDDLLNDLLKSA
jgi:hypothetical protein